MEREPGKRADAPLFPFRHKPMAEAPRKTLLGRKQRVLTSYRGHYVGNDESQCRLQKVKMILNSARVRTLLKMFLKSSF